MANITKSVGIEQFKGMFFGIIGILLILAAVIWAITNQVFINRSEMAEGTVTRLNAGGSHPEIKFTTREGNEIEFPQGGLIFGYRTGDKVTVYYEAENPRNCSIDSVGALWGFPFLVLALGICFVCTALFSNS